MLDELEIERAAKHAAALERARCESARARLEMLRAQTLADSVRWPLVTMSDQPRPLLATAD